MKKQKTPRSNKRPLSAISYTEIALARAYFLGQYACPDILALPRPVDDATWAFIKKMADRKLVREHFRPMAKTLLGIVEEIRTEAA